MESSLRFHYFLTSSQEQNVFMKLFVNGNCVEVLGPMNRIQIFFPFNCLLFLQLAFENVSNVAGFFLSVFQDLDLYLDWNEKFGAGK